MKKMYQYNGKTYTTITEIAKEVGKSRLSSKDFDKYGITVVDNTNQATPATTSQLISAHLSADGIVADSVAGIPHEVPTTYTTATTYVTVTTLTTTTPVKEDEVTRIEREVVDMTRHSFGTELSKLDMDSLIKMAKNVNVNLWEKMTNISIRRMRLVMELKEAYFPTNTPRITPPPTPWKGIPFDKLAQKAKDNGITWATDNHPNINRMRLIMALKKNGIQASDVE